MKDKTKCILCDIDGTLAILGKRSPYNASIAHIVDTLNVAVAETIMLFKNNGVKIIFITGRERKYESQTKEFIAKHLGWSEGIDYDLYMREDFDRRKDAIYKREIYDKFIEPNHQVLFALEDRNQMVEMYRHDLGLMCFQVADGNF